MPVSFKVQIIRQVVSSHLTFRLRFFFLLSQLTLLVFIAKNLVQLEQRKKIKMMSFRSLLRSQRSLSLRPSKKFLALHSSCSCYSASAAAIEAERTIREGPRHDWSKYDIKSIYDSPVLDLLFHGVCIFHFSHSICFCFLFLF